MKLTLKKMAFVLSLGLGVGMSASVSAYAASDGDCAIWEVKCAEGNERACLQWSINCYDYGGRWANAGAWRLPAWHPGGSFQRTER